MMRNGRDGDLSHRLAETATRRQDDLTPRLDV
jgi:hypothetical protein